MKQKSFFRITLIVIGCIFATFGIPAVVALGLGTGFYMVGKMFYGDAFTEETNQSVNVIGDTQETLEEEAEQAFDENSLQGVEEDDIGTSECTIQDDGIMIGTWQSGPSDYPANLFLSLHNNYTFVYKVEAIEGDDSYELHGTWEFSEEPSIKITFDELNDVWETILSDDKLMEDFDCILDYSYEDRLIVFEMGYMGELNSGECQRDRYYINWLNMFLYQKDW